MKLALALGEELLIRPDEIPNHGCLTARAYCTGRKEAWGKRGKRRRNQGYKSIAELIY
jgi:hypothetical protein